MHHPPFNYLVYYALYRLLVSPPLDLRLPETIREEEVC